jgi:diguanylate cyclase (GGDEF)-like protein
VSSKLLRILYRLLFPGGFILLASAIALKSLALENLNSSFWREYPYVIFGAGLVLSALFKCSRLFFAILIIGLCDWALTWITPAIASAGIHRTVFDAIALLLPLNLIALSFMRDRGIVSPRGRRRVAFVAAQIAMVALVALIQPAQALASGFMQGAIVPKNYSEWSHVSQPALLVFLVAGVVMLVYLADRRRPVESALFWSLVAAFVALNAGGANHIASAYFATGGLILSVAVLETSYTMAYRDELTQLPSRRALNQELAKMGDNYAIAMIDVDHFKSFNDTYGHETGDQVLQMIASRLADVSGGGKPFRYGGEEFAVVFPGKSVDDAYPNLESLRKRIEASPFKLRGNDRRSEGNRRKKATKRRNPKSQVQVTVSIGASSCDGEKRPPDQVLRDADKALYKAKSSGRNCTAVSV